MLHALLACNTTLHEVCMHYSFSIFVYAHVTIAIHKWCHTVYAGMGLVLSAEKYHFALHVFNGS